MKRFPLNKAFTFLEPGPVILVSTLDGDKPNVMTLSWTMVLDFTPRFAFMTGPWNYSYKALSKTKECVIAVPAAGMSKTVVSIGSCSGAEVDKFKKFKLTPLEGEHVRAPLIKECYANIECRVVDYVGKYGIFVLDAAAAWVDETGGERSFFHAVGDGRFVVDGEKINHRKIMLKKLPDGV
ncbi:MAG: flavin reductase family protein [Treponema sp.]|jgi:flavin reductase (DIM6/NTAB) family NADH-FMN oxidoreductase RutF|nr:flavin reductase family protein [Treponema sp.]